MTNAIKIGDTVRYLNAVGGGKVVGFQSKDLVLVLEDDGFETPIMTRDVVVVEETNAYNFPKSTAAAPKQQAPTDTPTAVPTPQPTKPLYTFDEAEETADGEALSLYLAFVPTKIAELQTSPIACYLINDSNYYINFQITLGNDQTSLFAAEVIEPQTKLNLGVFEKTALNDWEFVHLQGFAFKQNKAFVPKPTIDALLHLTLTKFYKLHSFTSNDFFDQKAMMVTILENDYPEAAVSLDAEALQSAFGTKQQAEAARPQSSKEKPAGPMEIDLHISALLDSWAGMSNSELLEVQMDKFHKVMKENLKNKGKKIVFIHGKGEGVLRSAIEKELRSAYRSCTFQDASFRQYGFGATLVTIR